MEPKHSLASAEHAAKRTAAADRRYAHHNRMNCHVVTLSVVMSTHFDAGDHLLEAVQRSSLLQRRYLAMVEMEEISLEMESATLWYTAESGRQPQQFLSPVQFCFFI